MFSKSNFRTASKNKRMTIEEAINFNNNLRFSSFQRAKWYTSLLFFSILLQILLILLLNLLLISVYHHILLFQSSKIRLELKQVTTASFKAIRSLDKILLLLQDHFLLLIYLLWHFIDFSLYILLLELFLAHGSPLAAGGVKGDGSAPGQFEWDYLFLEEVFPRHYNL